MKRSRVVFAAVLALLVGSCTDTTGPGPQVFVTLAGSPQVRAVQFRLVGRQTAVTAMVDGSTIYTSMPSGDTITVVVIAPRGQVMTGPVARVSVPDQVAALHDDVLILVQLAASDYSLLSRFDYTLTLKVAAQL